MQFTWRCVYFEFKIWLDLWPISSRFGRCRDTLVQVLNCGGPLVAQMLEQDVAEFAAGSATQRLQDGLVFAHRLTPALPLAGKIGGVANPANPPGEIGISALERRVARGFDDLLVDQLVDAKITVHVAVQVETVHLVMQ